MPEQFNIDHQLRAEYETGESKDAREKEKHLEVK